MTPETSLETEELAWELQQDKPDTHRIKWLVHDMKANVLDAMQRAHLREEDLVKRPALRALQLQQHLHAK